MRTCLQASKSESCPGRRIGSQSLGWPERAGAHQWVVARGLPGVGCPTALEVRLVRGAPGPGKRGTAGNARHTRHVLWGHLLRNHLQMTCFWVRFGFILHSSSLAEVY